MSRFPSRWARRATAVTAGGVVLALGAGWCGLSWRRSVGVVRTVALVGVYVGVFVLSHVIADAVGTWPAVVLAATVAGLAALLVADMPASRAAAAA